MKWTEENIEFLKNNYGILSLSEIAKCLNTTKSSIACKSTRLGLTKKNNGNVNIFEKINTEESAYWLGFIYADGYIVKNIKDKNHCNYELGIELNSIDIKHLSKFNSIFNNYYKIESKVKNMNSIDILNNKEISHRTHETCLIRIYNKKIVEDLINNDLVQNKTNSDIFPKIEDDEMFLHFLRGYIDGDGSYVIDKNGRIKISIAGNNEKCFIYILKRLRDKYNINGNYYKDRSCFKLQISKKEDVLKLIDLLFDNANIYLDRKFEKIINIKKAVYDRNIINN